MKKILRTFLMLMLVGCASVYAQSYRVTDLAERLSQQAEELSDRIYSDFNNRYSNSRSDVETLMLAQQISAAANVFRRMTQDRRRETELRDAASYLLDLSRRAPSYSSNSNAWRDVQRTADDLGRELRATGAGGYGNDNYPQQDENIVGRVRWRGTVDDEIHLIIRDQTIEVRTISGSDNGAGSYNFTSPLPNSRRKLTVSANKIKGRGEVRVIQQPTAENNFTAVVSIRDSSGGAKEYELDITWRR